jgi:hypothetical protein
MYEVFHKLSAAASNANFSASRDRDARLASGMPEDDTGPKARA